LHVRRDTGERYDEFFNRLAVGIETQSKEELAQRDNKRKSKGSNDDWTHPQDPDAKIGMKDGRTHLLHKAEQAVDLETGRCWRSRRRRNNDAGGSGNRDR
jgi:transposase